MGLADDIRTALTVLVGLPICAAARAGGTATLQFGECQKHQARGREAVIGTWALHLQCAWRLAEGSAIVVGSDDFLHPENEDSNLESFDPDQHRSRYTGRIEAWLRGTPVAQRTVTAVSGTRCGDLTIQFAGGAILEGFAVDSQRGEYAERWRLFRPGTDSPHFVVRGTAEDA